MQEPEETFPCLSGPEWEDEAVRILMLVAQPSCVPRHQGPFSPDTCRGQESRDEHGFLPSCCRVDSLCLKEAQSKGRCGGPEM